MSEKKVDGKYKREMKLHKAVAVGLSPNVLRGGKGLSSKTVPNLPAKKVKTK